MLANLRKALCSRFDSRTRCTRKLMEVALLHDRFIKHPSTPFWGTLPVTFRSYGLGCSDWAQVGSHGVCSSTMSDFPTRQREGYRIVPDKGGGGSFRLLHFSRFWRGDFQSRKSAGDLSLNQLSRLTGNPTGPLRRNWTRSTE